MQRTSGGKECLETKHSLEVVQKEIEAPKLLMPMENVTLDGYDGMTRATLREIAKAHGIKYWRHTKKAKLIELLQKNDVNPTYLCDPKVRLKILKAGDKHRSKPGVKERYRAGARKWREENPDKVKAHKAAYPSGQKEKAT